MITYAFDSNGEIIRAGMENPYFASEKKRLDAMNTIRLAILPYLKPFGANDKTFSVAIQPYGYEDRLIWFTKIHAQSDSDIVKMSQNALINKNYVYESKAEEYIFNSVFRITENDMDSWYLLYAESLCFKRNIFDKKIIDVVFEDPVPYGEFITKNRDMRISKKELILEERTDKMKFLSPKVDFENEERLLHIALPRTNDKNLDAYFKEGLKDILQAVEQRDKHSNEKTKLLMYLKDNPSAAKEAKAFYKDLCIWANEEFTDDTLKIVSCLRNVIKISNGHSSADVYVCKEPENTNLIFIVNGKVYKKTDFLKKSVITGQCFESAPDWWEKILLTIDD